MGKKEYMKKYNQREYVKERKKLYMRKQRAEKEEKAARHLVNMFLEAGFEDLAYQYALERAPDMLVEASKSRTRDK